jgi:hypothetical protein
VLEDEARSIGTKTTIDDERKRPRKVATMRYSGVERRGR